MSSPDIPEGLKELFQQTWFDHFSHYGLFLGAIFQLICIATIVNDDNSAQNYLTRTKICLVGRLKETGKVGLMARKDKMWHKLLKDLVQGLPPQHKVMGVARTKLAVQERKQERENERFDKLLMCRRNDRYCATLVPSLLMILQK